MTEPIRVFLGYDKREAAGYHVCVQSIMEHASAPVSITALSGDARDGSNSFIYERFMTPAMCDYQGWAIFADGSDMLFRDDIAKLWAMRGHQAVSVVMRDYTPRTGRKYKGTAMECNNAAYDRKNWSSLMLFRCDHPANKILTRDTIAEFSGEFLHRFQWLDDRQIGGLPFEWNVLIGEDGEETPAAVAHFTLGIPAFPAYADCKYADEWRAVAARAGRAG